MSAAEAWNTTTKEDSGNPGPPHYPKSGFDPQTGIYHSINKLSDQHKIPTRPDLDIATYVLSHFPPPHQAESKIALIDSATNQQFTYAWLQRSIRSLAKGLYRTLGVGKGDVVFVLSPNSLLYPTICLAVFSIGAILTTANPLNTKSEIAKQVSDSGAKLAISAPEELHKLVPTGVPTILTSRKPNKDSSSLSIEELIESSDHSYQLPQVKLVQSDTAAILYSSGTTGTSKGVVLTHAHFIADVAFLRWTVDVSSAQNDVFLCFLPIFHIYGLSFFALGLFCVGTTTVVMKKYEFHAMLQAIKTHKVNNIPAVPPVILGLVKYTSKAGFESELSSLRRVTSGAAPLSKVVGDGFRKKFPWVELRQVYGLTEICGAATFSPTHKEAKARSGSSGMLIPSFCAKVVDTVTGKPLPPYREGEVWLKSPSIMKGYLGNVEATAATIDSDGWLKTGDICYFDEDGFLFIVDRVAPAELEAILLSHPSILDAAVIPVENDEAGQIPMAYVVKEIGSELSEDQVIKFVADQVAPYKKLRRVSFTSAIPRSISGKILRKNLVSQSKQQFISKL
ncbi:4-coumarate--coa ligase-like 5 [Quercus suber]|uniref:4-coumarate--coa ligase-like 5 n=1 Tax=Quercus suber TaxID=58331 RepID=A0AAW0M736_QUESU